MKIITFIYIFALFVLCSPGIMYNNGSFHFLSTLLFSIILYFSIDYIGNKKEYLTENDDLTIETTNLFSLVNKLNEKLDQKINDINVEVNEKIRFTPIQDVSNITKQCLKKMQELEQYKVEVKQLKDDLASYIGLARTKVTLKKTLNKLEEKEADLNSQVEKLNTTIKNKDTEINNRQEIADTLQGTINDLSGNIVDLNDDINDLVPIILQDEKDIGTQDAKISSLNTEINERKEQIISRNTEIGTIMENIKQINKTIMGKLQVISKNKKDLTHLQEEIDEKDALIKRVSDTKRDTTNELNKFTKSNQTLQTDISNNAIDITKLENDLKVEQTNIDNYKANVASKMKSKPDELSCPAHWITWLKTKCPAGRQCFADNYEIRGEFIDHYANGTSFKFKPVYNSRIDNYWSAWTVANSWTHRNNFVEFGYTTVPMKYAKVYL